jgi:plasmid stabilization system protein ParE
MPLSIRFLPDADKDLKRLYEFLSAINRAAAKKALQAIYADIELLSQHPEIGKPLREPLYVREYYVNFGMRGYIVHYRTVGAEIIIMRIWHGAEKRS